MQSVNNRAVALFDGMNMYHHAKNAFGDRDGRYDPVKLAGAIANSQKCELVQTRFYVGVPTAARHRRIHDYWRARLSAMQQRGVFVFRGSVNYSGNRGQEKGVDIRIALDSIQLILDRTCDTIIIFSTDQDFRQIKPTALNVARRLGTSVRIKSAFPETDVYKVRGIDGTDWIPFGLQTYKQSIDHQNYWPR
ncbi:MAG: NYN domain-containing protein [Chloroflexi bacterium]|nr:NYN domain-containing protein [Chloroflexota bacterium]